MTNGSRARRDGSNSNLVTTILQSEVRTIPLVFISVSDPIGSGFVTDLARPTGNVTGFANFQLIPNGGSIILTSSTVGSKGTRNEQRLRGDEGSRALVCANLDHGFKAAPHSLLDRRNRPKPEHAGLDRGDAVGDEARSCRNAALLRPRHAVAIPPTLALRFRPARRLSLSNFGISLSLGAAPPHPPCPLRLVPRSRLVQSLGLCFYPLLKCLKRFIVLLPDAAVRVADDLRTRAGLSLSYDAIASRRECGFPNDVHHYKWTPSWPSCRRRSSRMISCSLLIILRFLLSGFPFRL
jgi:hypothetical protein